MIVAASVFAAGCGSKSSSQGTGGAGGSAAGHGGISGAGGQPITSCPASNPWQTIACSGTFGCQFDAGCSCYGCCFAFWTCVNGTFMQTDFNDSCAQGPPGNPGIGGAAGCGDGGVAGASGGQGGTGGGGGGGTTGLDGAAPISACPMARPAVATPCTGTFTCNYDDTCRCGVCCYSGYRCTNERIEFLGSNDGCLQLTCDAGACGDAGTNPDSGSCL